MRELFEHNGFYYHEDKGEYVTYSWTGIDDKYTPLVIGYPEEEARKCLGAHPDGEFGGGLCACNEHEVVEVFAEQCSMRDFE